MAIKALVSVGRKPVNSLQVGQMVRFHSLGGMEEIVMTIRHMKWLKDKVIIASKEVNDVVFNAHDWVEVVETVEEE